MPRERSTTRGCSCVPCVGNDAALTRVVDELREPLGLRLRGRSAGRRELVVAAPSIIRLTGGSLSFGNEAGVLEPHHREVKRSGAGITLALGDLADALDDAPAVGGSVMQRE